jgi:hypothetical protein
MQTLFDRLDTTQPLNRCSICHPSIASAPAAALSFRLRCLFQYRFQMHALKILRLFCSYLPIILVPSTSAPGKVRLFSDLAMFVPTPEPLVHFILWISARGSKLYKLVPLARGQLIWAHKSLMQNTMA